MQQRQAGHGALRHAHRTDQDVCERAGWEQATKLCERDAAASTGACEGAGGLGLSMTSLHIFGFFPRKGGRTFFDQRSVMFRPLDLINLLRVVKIFAGLLVAVSAFASEQDFPVRRDTSKIGTTSWVKQSVEPINVFAPTTATFPLELSIDPMTQEEVKWVHQQIYDWAVLDNQKLKQKLRNSAQSNYEKGLYDQKKLKTALSQADYAHWGCLSWLFIKEDGVKKPVGFRLHVQNTTARASGLKVNGQLRERFLIGNQEAISSGVFVLRDFTPIVSIKNLVESKDAWGYNRDKFTGAEHQLRAFSPATTEVSYKRSEKDRVVPGLRVDERSGRCTLLDAACRTYSFDVETLHWEPFSWGLDQDRSNNFRLKRQFSKPVEFVFEDPCILNLGSTFEQSSPGVSRAFGQSISNIYVRLKDGSRKLKMDDKVLEDQIKPFLEARKN